MHRRLQLAVIASLISVGLTGCAERPVPVADWPLGKFEEVARQSLAPVFPEDIGTDVPTVVFYADLTTGTDGRVDSVRIPGIVDARISRAVQAAVLGWQFPPVSMSSNGQRLRGAATLRFEFDPATRRVILGHLVSGEDRPPATITRLRFDRLNITPGVMLIDIRDRLTFRRGHRIGALNLPADELEDRIDGEIGAEITVAIDCSRSQVPVCEAAASELVKKYRKVIILSDDTDR